MRFFHYTAPVASHLGSILDSGVIKTTESNASLTTERMAPDVVWGTDRLVTASEDVSHGLYYKGAMRMRLPAEVSSDIKTQARIECEVPDAVPYLEWIRTVPHDPLSVTALVAAGGGQEAATSWYVVPRPITADEFVAIYVRGVKHVRNAFTGAWVETSA